MKTRLLAIFLLVMMPLLDIIPVNVVQVAHAQTTAPAYFKSYNFTATGNQGADNIQGRGLSYFKIQYTNQASITSSACTIVLQTSPDNVTWSTGITATCTTDGSSSFTAINTSYIRLNLSAFTPGIGGGRLTVTISGSNDISGSSTAILATDGTSNVALQALDLTNAPVASTLTSRNSVGLITNDPPSWGVTATLAAGSGGTVSIAAEANVRHIVKCVSWSATATSTPSLTAVTVNLRDGATGAGTVLQSWTQAVSATTGLLIPVSGVCGLNLAGTTNTAMTLEFASGTANVVESVNMTGVNVN